MIARLQVFSTCTELIKTLPALVYDKTRVEDCDTNGEDHGPDALRYGLMSNPKSSPNATVNPVVNLLTTTRAKEKRVRNWK